MVVGCWLIFWWLCFLLRLQTDSANGLLFKTLGDDEYLVGKMSSLFLFHGPKWLSELRCRDQESQQFFLDGNQLEFLAGIFVSVFNQDGRGNRIFFHGSLNKVGEICEEKGYKSGTSYERLLEHLGPGAWRNKTQWGFFVSFAKVFGLKRYPRILLAK